MRVKMNQMEKSHKEAMEQQQVRNYVCMWSILLVSVVLERHIWASVIHGWVTCCICLQYVVMETTGASVEPFPVRLWCYFLKIWLLFWKCDFVADGLPVCDAPKGFLSVQFRQLKVAHVGQNRLACSVRRTMSCTVVVLWDCQLPVICKLGLWYHNDASNVLRNNEFVFTVQEQGADEASGCPLERKKVWPDRKFTAAALTMGQPAGNDTERLHFCNTVKVSLLFPHCHQHQLFLDWESQRPCCTWKSVAESKKSFCKKSTYFRYFMATFPLDQRMWLWMVDGALAFNTAGPKQKAWCAYVDNICQLSVSTSFLWMSCNLFIQLYFLSFLFPHNILRAYPTFRGFLQ